MFHNTKNRFVEFSDGVFSVILTILVLEIQLPKGNNIFSHSWEHFGYSILIYIAGFSLISTYWFFHQKLFHSVDHISGSFIVLNFYFLFFISLMPLLTRLIAQNPLNKLFEFIYGLVYLIFNIYLWWIFKVVYKKRSSQKQWSEHATRESLREIKIVKNTVIVGAVACLSSLIWGPLTPIILALSPSIRDAWNDTKRRITS